jgi:hypothetical protein
MIQHHRGARCDAENRITTERDAGIRGGRRRKQAASTIVVLSLQPPSRQGRRLAAGREQIAPLTNRPGKFDTVMIIEQAAYRQCEHRRVFTIALRNR